MLRRSVWLLVLSGGAGALGCSDPVPAAASVGLRLQVAAPCGGGPPVNDDLGNPAPDKDRIGSEPKKGRPVYHGEGGVRASCRVSGSGPYTVSAAVSAENVSFSIDNASVGSNGMGSGRMGFTSTSIGGSLEAGDCSITAVTTDTGPGVKAGAIWASFICPTLKVASTINSFCGTTGEFLLENCQQ